MKNAIFAFIFAAVAVSCVQSTEEVVVEEVVVDTTAAIDSTSLEVEAEGVEAAAEYVLGVFGCLLHLTG